MAGRPITFRNVAGPDFRGGNALLLAANRNINQAIQGGVSQLQGLAREQEGDATAAAINRINQLDVAGVEAAKASGEFGDVRFGDTNKILAALQGRTTAARGEENAAFQFEQNQITQANQLADQAESEGVANIQSLLAAGRTDEARTALDASDFRAETDVGLEQSLFDRTRQVTQDTRTEEAFQRGEVGRERTETLNAAILDFQTGRAGKVATIQEDNAEFARNSQGQASFDGSGNLVIADGVTGPERDSLITAYVSQRNAGPKLKTARQRRDEFTKLANKSGATPAELRGGLAELKSFNDRLLQLEPEDIALKAGADQAAQDRFDNSIEQESIVRDEVLRTHPVDPEITAFREDARGGASVQPGELIQTEITAALAAGDPLVEDIEGDLQPGREIPQLVEAMNSTVDAGFQRGTETIPYPGWVVRAAFKSVGLRSLYDPGIIDDTVDARPFQDALKRIMKQNLREEENGIIRAQAVADFSSKKLQLRTTLNNVSSANQRAAQSRSGVFTDSGLSSLLDREATRLAQGN